MFITAASFEVRGLGSRQLRIVVSALVPERCAVPCRVSNSGLFVAASHLLVLSLAQFCDTASGKLQSKPRLRCTGIVDQMKTRTIGGPR